MDLSMAEYPKNFSKMYSSQSALKQKVSSTLAFGLPRTAKNREISFQK